MEKFIHAIEEKNQGFMAHSLCPYYTTYHPLNVDFLGFSALLYDIIRGFCLGLCRQVCIVILSDDDFINLRP